MDVSSAPQDTTVAELSPVAAVDAPVEAPPAATPTPVATKPRGHAAGVIGAALGGMLTLGVTVGVRLLLTARKRKSKACSKAQQASAASTPKHASTAAGSQFISFGSPTPMPDFGSPRMIGKTLAQAVSPTASLQQEELKPVLPPVVTPEPEPEAAVAEAKATLPAGQLKQQLQMLQELQAENARLSEFIKQYSTTSDKLKTLEQENSELKSITNKLQSQLNDIKSKAVVSNGDELSSFKDAVRDRFPAIARSVCSDIDFDKLKDTASVDGSASVMDVNTRKKMGALSQLFAWASQPAVPKKQSSKPSSQAPSQVSTPRRPTRTTQDGVQSADVLQLLNAFSSGGMQF